MSLGCLPLRSSAIIEAQELVHCCTHYTMKRPCGDERKGGGYLQRQKKRDVDEQQRRMKLQQSHLAGYLVP